MTSTSSTTIVIDQIGAAFAADMCAMALKNTETSAIAIAQPAPLYTAKAATSWTTPQIRKNQPHACRLENSTWFATYAELRSAATPLMMFRKPTRKRMMQAKSSHVVRVISLSTEAEYVPVVGVMEVGGTPLKVDI